MAARKTKQNMSGHDLIVRGMSVSLMSLFIYLPLLTIMIIATTDMAISVSNAQAPQIIVNSCNVAFCAVGTYICPAGCTLHITRGAACGRGGLYPIAVCRSAETTTLSTTTIPSNNVNPTTLSTAITTTISSNTPTTTIQTNSTTIPSNTPSNSLV